MNCHIMCHFESKEKVLSPRSEQSFLLELKIKTWRTKAGSLGRAYQQSNADITFPAEKLYTRQLILIPEGWTQS